MVASSGSIGAKLLDPRIGARRPLIHHNIITVIIVPYSKVRRSKIDTTASPTNADGFCASIAPWEPLARNHSRKRGGAIIRAAACVLPAPRDGGDGRGFLELISL